MRTPYPKNPELHALWKLYNDKYKGLHKRDGYAFGYAFKEMYVGLGYTHLVLSITDKRSEKAKLEIMPLEAKLEEYNQCYKRLMKELGIKDDVVSAKTE